MKKYLLRGLFAGLLTSYVCFGNTVFAGEMEAIVKDNTTSSGFSIKEETGDTTIARFRGDGNVGIATTSPTEKLEVSGNVKATKFIGDGSELTGITGGNGKFVDGTDTNDAVYTSGNVGIGTTAPGALLHTTTNGNNIIRFDSFSSVDGERVQFSIGKSASDSVGTLSETATGDFLGSIFFEGIDSNGGFDAGAAIQAEQTGASGSRVPTKLIFKTSSASTVHNTAMVIDSAGNVGIGTTAPTEKLDVAGNINASGAVTQGSSRAIKDNIMHISSGQAMRAFEQLEPVSFVYKDDSSREERLGFIAEDVPDLVATQDRKHLNAMDLTAVLTKVVQEQQKMLQTQQEAMSEMKREIKMMKSAMNYGVKGL